MSDETAAPQDTPSGEHRPFPTPEKCFETWLENKGLGFGELAKLLQEEGFRCSKQWLHSVKENYRPWLEAYVVFRTENISPERILSALRIATNSAKEITPEALIGVKARLVAKLFDAIDTMPVNDVDTWERLLDCAPKIDAMIHAQRGLDISEGKKIEAGKAAKASIISQFQPKPAIDPIKAPAAVNGGKH